MAGSRAAVVWEGMLPSAIGDDVADRWEDIADELVPELEGVGQDMQGFARSSHPWRNRSGEAEAGLDYDVSREGDAVVLTLYQGADHGIFLEERWDGRWGVLPQTMTLHYGHVMDAVRRAVRW